MQRFQNAKEAALTLRPDDPVYCFRPDVLKADAIQFMGMFPGKTAYAVKTNGERIVLNALVEAGVTAFDVASPGEFAAVRDVSADAEMLYMHPVKAQSDIRLALEKYGIRVIAVDHEDEIAKLTRIVRARVDETLEMLRDRLGKSGYGATVGRRVVLTGGASQLAGLPEAARRILGRNVRIGRPLGVAGLPEAAKGPAFSVPVGLLIYPQVAAFESHPAQGMSRLKMTGTGGRLHRMSEWFRDSF